MVLASGQMPYEYPFTIPLRAGVNAWPGVGVSIGASGDVLEQGAFVINAELRKWGLTDENLLSNGMKVYTHPDIVPSGFDPKPTGDTLAGLVGNVAALADVDNIPHLRFMLDEVCGRYANDSDYQRNDHLRAWLVSAYGLPSGHRRTTQVGPGVSITNSTWTRPELNDVTGGDPIETTDIHWLGGSGVLFDVDMGEVIFQPFPFPGEGFKFSAITNTQRFHFAPFYPSFQKTDGSLITLTGREIQAADNGTWKARTNVGAIGSGKVQLDGYAIRPDTNVRLINGLDDAWSFEGDGTPDFTLPVQGLRAVSDGNGKNDNTARTYWTTKLQASGVYRVITDTPLSIAPNIVMPSGSPVSLWPQGGYRFETINGVRTYAPVINRALHRSFSVASNGGTIIKPALSNGYQVFDDCIWMTTRQLAGSGNFDAFAAVLPISPYNGNFMWFRPAERVIATKGNVGDNPGHFQVQLGFEPKGTTEILRLSKSYLSEITSTTCGAMSNDDERTTTVYVQRYSWPGLSHLGETVVAMPFCEENGETGGLGNTIVSFTFDGTSYWIGSNTGRRTRLTSALAFDGFFAGPNTGRLHRGNGVDLYTVAGGAQIGDPLLDDVNMDGIASASSGIGTWSIFSEPTDISNDAGVATHDSAKPIRAETHVGHRVASTCRIHDIIYIAPGNATHQTPGLWVLISFNRNLFLFRLDEQATEYLVTTSIELDYLGDTHSFPNSDDFPYEIAHFDIS